MRFTLTIDLDNACFAGREGEDDLRDGDAIASMLREVSDRFDNCYVDATDCGVLRDFNGNTVGSWKVRE